MDSLKAHTLRIESGAVNLNCVQDVCGVKEQPLFDAIDTDHFVPPTLHLTTLHNEVRRGGPPTCTPVCVHPFAHVL
jgi:hypothetical protein